MKGKITLWLLTIVLVLAVSAFALAGELTGSQTITVEWPDGGERYIVSTSVLNYAYTDWLHFTFVVDIHPEWSTAVDVSTTVYIPAFDEIYATAGVRRGLYNNDLPTTPYVQVTVQF